MKTTMSEGEYQAYADHEPEPIWTTRDGRKIPVTEMTDSHLQNAIAMLERVHEPPNPADVFLGEYAIMAAEEEMAPLWDKYIRAQAWLRVLRDEKLRREVSDG